MVLEILLRFNLSISQVFIKKMAIWALRWPFSTTQARWLFRGTGVDLL